MLFPLLLKTVVPIQLLIVRKVLQTEHKTYCELYKALARDRWSTAGHLGPRLKLVMGELLLNDKLRVIVPALMRAIVAPSQKYDDDRDARVVADMLFNGIGARR